MTGLDRPIVFQELEAPIFQDHLAHEGGKIVIPKHRPPLTLGIIPGTHFC
jgi:hypothetical protein